jgi:hypothetical protein
MRQLPYAARCRRPADRRKALSGGLTFTTPTSVATAPNITGDVETGIGGWSDAEIKRALVDEMRPDHDRLAGVPLAAIMPAGFYKVLLTNDLDAIVACLRTVKPVRNEVLTPIYKTAVRCDPCWDAEAGIDEATFVDPIKRGAYHATIGHCMECPSAWSRGVSDFTTRLGRGGRPSPPREGTPEGTPPNITSHPTAPASTPGPIRKSVARSRWEPRATAEHSSRRWLRLLRRSEGWRSCGDHRSLAHGAAAAMMPWQNRRSTDYPEIVSCRRKTRELRLRNSSVSIRGCRRND